MLKDTPTQREAVAKAKAIGATHYQEYYIVDRRYVFNRLDDLRSLFAVTFFNLNIPCGVEGCVTEVAEWGQIMESFNTYQRPNHLPTTYPEGNCVYSRLMPIGEF